MSATRPSTWLGLLMIGYALSAASACSGSQYGQYPQGPAPVPDPAQGDDPPGRVGRLGYIEGPVSILAASADSWSVAEPNRPITTGDRLWADTGARTEIQVGPNALRSAGPTEIDIVRLTDHWLQVRVPQGTVNQRIRVLGPDEDYEIDTPNAAVSLTQVGEYRVDVSPDGGTTTVTVWSGEAQVTAAGSSFPVNARQVSTIRGENSLTYDLTSIGRPGDFDRWALDRDAREDRESPSLRYVSQDTPGVTDLDANGTWATDPGYGPVWYPTVVAVDWAPYRQGHWIWVSRWGWTWVDDAPWGFAPYHYGRWAYVGGRWGWCPGRSIAVPVFAPALVVFVGGPTWRPTEAFGPGGGVAWFPLAPEEPYYPTYAVDPAYRRRINAVYVTNITIVNNVTVVNYRNRALPGAITAVPSGVFIGAQPVHRAFVGVPPSALASARTVYGAPAVPSFTSFGAGVATRRIPPTVLATRPAVATHAPPPPPVPFAIQRRTLETNGGRPLTRGELTTLRPSAPAGPPIRSAETVAPGGRTLAPARPSLPVTPKPATTVFAPNASAEGITSARPAPRPIAPQGAATPGVPPAPRSPATPLDRSYQAERSAEEARHRTEFASPPAGESPAALSQRQESEHQELDQRYRRAQAAGAKTMPPPPKNTGPRTPEAKSSKSSDKEQVRERDRQ